LISPDQIFSPLKKSSEIDFFKNSTIANPHVAHQKAKAKEVVKEFSRAWPIAKKAEHETGLPRLQTGHTNRELVVSPSKNNRSTHNLTLELPDESLSPSRPMFTSFGTETSKLNIHNLEQTVQFTKEDASPTTYLERQKLCENWVKSKTKLSFKALSPTSRQFYRPVTQQVDNNKFTFRDSNRADFVSTTELRGLTSSNSRGNNVTYEEVSPLMPLSPTSTVHTKSRRSIRTSSGLQNVLGNFKRNLKITKPIEFMDGESAASPIKISIASTKDEMSPFSPFSPKSGKSNKFSYFLPMTPNRPNHNRTTSYLEGRAKVNNTLNYEKQKKKVLEKSAALTISTAYDRQKELSWDNVGAWNHAISVRDKIQVSYE